MKDRYVIRYLGLTIGVASGLLVPKILFTYLNEAVVAQVLLALGMGAFFAVVDLGTSRHIYSRLASLSEQEAQSQVSSAFSVVSFSAILSTCLSFTVIASININQTDTISIALVAAMGAFSVTLPWYKNLLDGAQMPQRGEWVLFVRRLQPLVFSGFIILGFGLTFGPILTGILLAGAVWMLFGMPKITDFRIAAKEYFSFIKVRSTRFDSMVWSICENLIYNSPMWFAFFLLPIEQQGVFVILMRLYNFLISIIRAPIEILFLPIRQKANGLHDLRKDTFLVTARSLIIVILLGLIIVPVIPYVMDYITNGRISASIVEVLSFYFIVVAATVIHPPGLATTSFPELIAWARVGSTVTVTFLFASVLIVSLFTDLTVSLLLMLFGFSILLNGLFLIYKIAIRG